VTKFDEVEYGIPTLSHVECSKIDLSWSRGLWLINACLDGNGKRSSTLSCSYYLLQVLQTVSKEPEQHHARITDVILVFND